MFVLSSSQWQREVGWVSSRCQDLQDIARAKGYSESLRGLAGGVTGVPTSCPEMDQHQPSSVGPMGAAPALGGGLQSPERESGLSQQCQSRTGLRGWFGKN